MSEFHDAFSSEHPRRYTVSSNVGAVTLDTAGFGQAERLRGPAPTPTTRGPRKGIHLRFQDGPNWHSPRGVYKKRRIIEKKGLPDFKGRRFITLTLDPDLFGGCPESAYLAGKEHMRRFLEAGRVHGLWLRQAWWAWKLEFQQSGWAHWHLILDRKNKFSYGQLRKMHEIWGLGRTNVRRISKTAFGYQFKYAFKGVFQEGGDSEFCLPAWFMNYYVPGTPETADSPAVKAKSFHRCRFWQTSSNFYTDSTPVPVREKKEPTRSLLPRPVSQVIEDSSTAVLVIARDRSGRYRRSCRVHLGVSFRQFVRVHQWGAEHGAGCTLSARSFVIDPHDLTKVINKTELCLTSPLLKENQLTVRRALQLRSQFKSLETC